MIFAKISIPALLVLSAICASESRHHYHNRHKSCRCREKSIPEPTEANTATTNDLDETTIEEDSKIEDQSIPENLLNEDRNNSTDLSKSGDPRIKIDDEDPKILPQSEIGSKPYLDNNLSAAWLKQLWLLHQGRNLHTDSTAGQNKIPYPTDPRDSIPWYTQFIPLSGYINIPHHHVKNEYKQEANAPPEFKVLTEEPIKVAWKDNRDTFSGFNRPHLFIPQKYFVNKENKQDDAPNDMQFLSDDMIKDFFINNNNKNKHDLPRFGTMPDSDIHNSIDSLNSEITGNRFYVPSLQKNPSTGHYCSSCNIDNQPINTPTHEQVISRDEIGNNNDLNNINNQPVKSPVSEAQSDFRIPYNYGPKLKQLGESKLKEHIDFNQPENYPVYPDSESYKTYEHSFPHENYDRKLPHETHYSIQATHISPDRLPHKHQEPGKFSKWVKEQTELLSNKNEGADKVDMSSLGYSVLQILSENGMYITDNGMLIDTYGTVSDINSLSLTPIIIGNTMSLTNLLQGKYVVKSSKQQTPYLQAILVSAKHPLKILGIMPLGTTYLPVSTLSTPTNIPEILTSGKSGTNDVETDNEPEQEPEKEPKTKKSKPNKLIRDDEENKYYKYRPSQGSNYINVNGNENNIARSNIIRYVPSRRGLRPDDDASDDRPYSKSLFVPITHNEEETNGRRVFIPHIEFNDNPIDILSRDVAQNDPASAQFKLPTMTNLFDVAIKTETVPVSIKSSPNIADILEEIRNPVGAALQNLKLLQSEIPLPFGGKIIANRRFQIPVKKWGIGDQEAILDYMVHAIPLEYASDIQSIPKFNLPIGELDFSSRSGGDNVVPDTPPEVNNGGNSAFDLVENDEDDDDGDFRIIGGNAATGSGTPLSNKGRSGNVY